MIKAVICDDELATRNIICHFLEEEQLPIEIVGNAEDGEEAIQLIKEPSGPVVQEAYGYYDSLLYSSASDRGSLSPALRS